MAGELLIQTIDLKRLETIRPVLDELDAGHVLSAAARAIIDAALATTAAQRVERDSGLEGLRRVLRRPEIAPRWFLAPFEIDDAVNALLYVTCFEEGDDWRLTGPAGVSWVVVEHIVPDMQRFAILDAAFFGGNRTMAQLPYPKRGELRRWRVDPAALPEVAAAAAALRAAATTPITVREAEGLARVAVHARDRRDATLVHVSLL